MIGIPFTVLFLSMAYSWLHSNPNLPGPAHRAAQSPLSNPQSLGAAVYAEPSFAPPEGALRRFIVEVIDSLHDLSPSSLVRWLALPLCLGALAVINTWDLPTYLGVITLTFWLVRYRRIAQNVSLAGPFNGTRLVVSIIQTIVFGGLTLAASYLLYLPFFANYHPLDVGLGLVHDKTKLGQFIKIWGLPLFVAVSHLLLRNLYPASRMAVLRTMSLLLRRWNVAPHMADTYGALVGQIRGGYWALLWLERQSGGSTLEASR